MQREWLMHCLCVGRLVNRSGVGGSGLTEMGQMRRGRILWSWTCAAHGGRGSGQT